MTQSFTLFVIQSAHPDIGYTHPPEQIVDMYLDHYDLVLDLCQRTADTSLPVNHYWHTNFPSSQSGFLHLRYRLIAGGPGNDEAALRSALPRDALGWRQTPSRGATPGLTRGPSDTKTG
ncbi:MAG TPA: hypothetical protein VMT24_08230 [Aggregatilineaceae bacterium]|nr:hypothetical protein [Aggregatilineaceae bacterium]